MSNSIYSNPLYVQCEHILSEIDTQHNEDEHESSYTTLWIYSVNSKHFLKQTEGTCWFSIDQGRRDLLASCRPVSRQKGFVGFMQTSVKTEGICWLHVDQCQGRRDLLASCRPVSMQKGFVGFTQTSVKAEGICWFQVDQYQSTRDFLVLDRAVSRQKEFVDFRQTSIKTEGKGLVDFRQTSIKAEGICWFQIEQCQGRRDLLISGRLVSRQKGRDLILTILS